MHRRARAANAGFPQAGNTSYDVGITGGRPGLNALNVTRAITVSADELAALKKVNDSVYEHRTEYSPQVAAPAAGRAGEVELFGTLYKAGAKPGELTYTMNRSDLQDTLKSIKNGKEYSDFMIATIHAHQVRHGAAAVSLRRSSRPTSWSRSLISRLTAAPMPSLATDPMC